MNKSSVLTNKTMSLRPASRTVENSGPAHLTKDVAWWLGDMLIYKLSAWRVFLYLLGSTGSVVVWVSYSRPGIPPLKWYIQGFSQSMTLTESFGLRWLGKNKMQWAWLPKHLTNNKLKMENSPNHVFTQGRPVPDLIPTDLTIQTPFQLARNILRWQEDKHQVSTQREAAPDSISTCSLVSLLSLLSCRARALITWTSSSS